MSNPNGSPCHRQLAGALIAERMSQLTALAEAALAESLAAEEAEEKKLLEEWAAKGELALEEELAKGRDKRAAQCAELKAECEQELAVLMALRAELRAGPFQDEAVFQNLQKKWHEKFEAERKDTATIIEVEHEAWCTARAPQRQAESRR